MTTRRKIGLFVFLLLVVLNGWFFFRAVNQAPPGRRPVHRNAPECEACNLMLKSCSLDLEAWFRRERTNDVTLHASASVRTKKAQESAFEHGKSHAHYGYSAHNYHPSRALDVFFLSDNQNEVNYDLPKLQAIAQRATNELVWGGSWDFKDEPHFEIPHWTNLVYNFPNGN